APLEKSYKQTDHAAQVTLAQARILIEQHTANAAIIQKVWQGSPGHRKLVAQYPPTLSNDDHKLAHDWAAHYPHNDYWPRAMESARGAELAALNIYRSLYSEAQDLSILQIQAPSDTRWMVADIQTSRCQIDVKNATTSFGSKNRYTEHIVRRHKKDQLGKDVVISAFLSPYRNTESSNVSEKDNVVRWLGETSALDIARLKREFESRYLFLELSEESNLLPPWMFDYPEEFYADRNQALTKIRENDFYFPDADYPIAVGVLAQRISKSEESGLQAEAYKLSQRCASHGNISRPRLFLHILDRFCRSTLDGITFPARDLRAILFPDNPGILSQVHNTATPLAVLDPVEIVYELLKVLEAVADHCRLRHYEFTSFKLNGQGIFRGKRADGPWQTITAYCGGWLPAPRRGKCGATPLYLGHHQVCERCGYLICNECGTCQDRCPNYGIRCHE
ncbi:MAG: hypothetical protein ACOYLN_16810, partial [Blastocatellia bacterium]